MNESERPIRSSRRQVLAGAAALAGGIGLPALGAPPAAAQIQANPAALALAIRKVVGEADIGEGKVKLDLPPLSENGNAVALTVTVDSPMTASDYVKSIHIFAEKNFQPNVISVTLGPRAGRPTVQTRVRLADTQNIIAIAELSDGTFWRDTANVIITLGACLEDLT